ncbi:hypothetical protein Tco_0311211, partial [Tanacetum coccineum]
MLVRLMLKLTIPSHLSLGLFFHFSHTLRDRVKLCDSVTKTTLLQDVILREKLLYVHRLITNIESLKNNPAPDFVFKSPSSFPIPVVDSDSIFEESDVTPPDGAWTEYVSEG